MENRFEDIKVELFESKNEESKEYIENYKTV